ncbi:MAG: ribonuclease P protein component [Aquificae bacterium]|nr:ribonuclease P protein component [Aquificota bacterium]
METLKNRRIRQLLKTGNSFKTKHLIVVWQENNLGQPRFAFIISRKFSKKAAERNRVKRVIKEALRLYGDSLRNLGYDIILIPKKEIFGKKTWQLADDIKMIGQILEKNVKKDRS